MEFSPHSHAERGLLLALVRVSIGARSLGVAAAYEPVLMSKKWMRGSGEMDFREQAGPHGR